MTTMRTKCQATTRRRWVRLAAVVAVVAALGGCVVYPVGYVEAPHHAYWSGRNWR